MADQEFDSVVERLHNINLALSALGRLSTATHDDGVPDYADRLGMEVLEKSATHVSAILGRRVTPAQLAQIAESGATDILTAAFTREQTKIRRAFEKAIEASLQPGINQPRGRQAGSIARIALAIGIGVLAATTGAPLAALAVGEPVTKEATKLAITGAVSALVAESANRVIPPTSHPPQGGFPLTDVVWPNTPQDHEIDRSAVKIAMANQKLDSVAERLENINLALIALGRLSTATHDDGVPDYADRLGMEVLEKSATHVSAILGRRVTPAQLAQIAESGATDILTAAFTREQTKIRRAFEKAIEASLQPGINQPRAPQTGSIARIALAIGIGILAATTGAPLAALAVGESVTKELIKAAITGAVSGLVTESAIRVIPPTSHPPQGGFPPPTGVRAPLPQYDEIDRRLKQLRPKTEQPPTKGDHTPRRTDGPSL
ncbi:hypothetical protein [Micromonospora sp. AB353]|uniref:hypothetical protein n=1 Tax=Micromonospora sp. AB353 TaxID=3413282 RepID=UPI003C1FDDA7